MKHYFYFKKGQPVPTWLFRPTSLVPNQWMTFTANGKVMVDDQTGQAFIWPTDQHYRSIIHSSGHPFDCGGPDFTNLMWTYRPLSFGFFKRRHKQIAPLVSARIGGVDIRTSTKCLPIPAHFERCKGGEE